MGAAQYDTCELETSAGYNETGGMCRSRSTVGEFHAGAMALFIISELLQGMAVAPKVTMSMTYIDDNVKDQSPSHFGILHVIPRPPKFELNPNAHISYITRISRFP